MSELFGLSASRWCDVFADINVSGVDKATGIDAFVRYLRIDRSQTIAFGDGGNDIPMLRAAGIGIAMGNASSTVKECADYITGTVDEDGIESALRYLGLI